MSFFGRAGRGYMVAGALMLGTWAWAGPPHLGVLVHLRAQDVAAFNARHATTAARLNPTRDLYLVRDADQRSDEDLLQEIQTDPTAQNPSLNGVIHLVHPRSLSAPSQNPKASNKTLVQLDGQSTASVLNGQSTASVLNGQSTASVLNGWVSFYGTRAPAAYVNQAAVSQVNAGASAHARATGQGTVVALVDNGVDPFNPVLRRVLLRWEGYNFYDGSRNWSAFADLNGQSTASVLNGQSTASVLNGQSTASVLNGDQTTVYLLDGQSTASVLNGQSTASVLNGQSTASVLNGGTSCLDGQSTASVLNGQSTASVLNGQSTASVLNGQSTASVLNGQSTASVLNGLAHIMACYPEFGHGTAVAGLIHLVAPGARILPIKAFGPDGSADAAAIYQAITYAIDRHADVINLSFSATDTTEAIREAIQEAVSDGIVVTAAAGNSNSSAAVFPATLDGVIGVGAVDGSAANPTFPRAEFSNFDPGTGQFVDVDVAAPGVNLFTTYPGFGLLWASASGTSFSTPLVSGEAALLVQLGVTGSAGKSAIEGATDAGIAGNADGELGHGLIDVAGALSSAAPAGGGLGRAGWDFGEFPWTWPW